MIETNTRPRLNQGRLIDRSPEADTYIIVEDHRQSCMKCNRHTFHDIYATVEGSEIAIVKMIIKCRDCETETTQNPKVIK